MRLEQKGDKKYILFFTKGMLLRSKDQEQYHSENSGFRFTQLDTILPFPELFFLKNDE